MVDQSRLGQCYDILGIPNTATIEEVTHTYRALAMKIHPDKGGSEGLMKLINQAYESITDNKPEEFKLPNLGVDAAAINKKQPSQDLTHLNLVILGEKNNQFTSMVNQNSTVSDFYKAQLGNMKTYGYQPARNYKDDGIIVGDRFFKSTNETVSIAQLKLVQFTPVLLTVNGIVKINLSAMQDLYQSYITKGTFYKDAKLIELAMHLRNAGARPHNSSGQCNPCRTFSTPKGIQEMQMTLDQTGAYDGATYSWGYF